MAGDRGRALRGARPADLPIARLAPLELLPNLKTTAAVGLCLPQNLLPRADKPFE